MNNQHLQFDPTLLPTDHLTVIHAFKIFISEAVLKKRDGVLLISLKSFYAGSEAVP